MEQLPGRDAAILALPKLPQALATHAMSLGGTHWHGSSDMDVMVADSIPHPHPQISIGSGGSGDCVVTKVSVQSACYVHSSLPSLPSSHMSVGLWEDNLPAGRQHREGEKRRRQKDGGSHLLTF